MWPAGCGEHRGPRQGAQSSAARPRNMDQHQGFTVSLLGVGGQQLHCPDPPDLCVVCGDRASGKSALHLAFHEGSDANTLLSWELKKL